MESNQIGENLENIKKFLNIETSGSDNESKDEDTEAVLLEKVKYKTGILPFLERNRIIFGAPGTGKSNLLEMESEKIIREYHGKKERVTFYPDYTYSQFVGTYKPTMNEAGEIGYEYVAGPFIRTLVKAIKSAQTDSPKPFILLVEEINRAKAASVFGDVFQLLDRDSDGVSEYEIHCSEDLKKYLAKEFSVDEFIFDSIRIPDNMFIWSTMNSADQGVYPVDTAFKRRWNFEYIGINKYENIIDGIGKFKLNNSEELIEWNTLRKAINEKLSSVDFKINEDKLMGPFFLGLKSIKSDEQGIIIDQERFMDVFKSKVLMYLYEDAVKQAKHRFFDGCDSSKYSSICEAFDNDGLKIFGVDFSQNYYEPQRNRP